MDKQMRLELSTLRHESDQLNSRVSSLERIIVQMLKVNTQSALSGETPDVNQEMPVFPNQRADPMQSYTQGGQSQEAGSRQMVLKQERKNAQGSSSAAAQKRYWSEEEHEKYLFATFTVGKNDVARISHVIGSRTSDQVRSHAQKYSLKLDKLLKEIEERFKPNGITLSQALSPLVTALQTCENAPCELMAKIQSVGISVNTSQQLLKVFGAPVLNTVDPVLVRHCLFMLNTQVGQELTAAAGQSFTMYMRQEFATKPDLWGGPQVQMVSSETMELFNGKALNCKLFKPFAELLFFYCLKNIGENPWLAVSQILNVYNQFSKVRDPVFYQLFNTAHACNLADKLEIVCILTFCYHVAAVAGK